ncbi:hypothetical protein [Erwinia mallotivora]|uniref:hypothetical protein n=1 Tax=Erwinia mallotivora TaxID=69222 RepID=UPI00126785A5|nr:hypothetical protein [Erwinia mallotivora]
MATQLIGSSLRSANTSFATESNKIVRQNSLLSSVKKVSNQAEQFTRASHSGGLKAAFEQRQPVQADASSGGLKAAFEQRQPVQADASPEGLKAAFEQRQDRPTVGDEPKSGDKSVSIKKTVSFNDTVQRMYIEGNDGDADSISSLNSLSDG